MALVLFVTVSLLAARDAQTALLSGQANLEMARDALAAADIEGARDAFTRAARHIDDGSARLDSPAMRWTGVVPVLGGNLAGARDLARAGGHVAAAGLTVTDAVADLPGGLAAFAPRDGALPIEPLERLADPLASSARDLAAAEEAIATAPDGLLLGSVARSRQQAVAQVAAASDALRVGAALAAELPTFLGADGPRRYFLGAQNPAELRGTGGLIGAFAILTADRGRLDISDFQNISELTRAAPAQLPAPSEDYVARYDRYSAAVHGSNINMTPDVPTAARAVETLYEAVTGEPVDGTILTDPLFLRALLDVVGPTDVPDIGRVDASGIVRFVTQEQYEVLAGDSGERKEALGEIAAAVLRRFLAEGPGDPRRAIALFGDAARDGRLLLHARDEDVQDAFAVAGLDGAMAEPDGDYLAVIGNNAGGNKADAFLERETTYDVTLQPDGTARGHLTVSLTNTAPASGLHPTVIGPFVGDLSPGESRTLWSVYCAPGCELAEFRRDGERGLVAVERERGRPVFTTTVQLPSGGSQVLEFEWTLADVWHPTGARGAYRLDVDAQPSLVAASDTRIQVSAPDDVRVSGARPPATTRGGQAEWRDQTLAGSFQVWFEGSEPATRRFRDALARPLLELIR